MPKNCGLEALAQLTELKNISAFTLVHAARDNGLNLFVFKVNDLEDLPRVQRPAIFHQEDHFVHVKNGEAMPQGKYTGYVIGQAVLGRVIGLQEAKFIKGGKNFLTGKNKDGVKEGGGALGAVLSVVGAAVGSLIPGLGTIAGASLGTIGGGAVGGAVGNAITGDNPLIGGLEGAGIGLAAGNIAGAFGAGGSSAAGLASGNSALSSNAIGQGAFNAARTGLSFAPTAQSGLDLAGQVGAFNAVNSAAVGGAAGLAGGSLINNGGLGFNASGAANGTLAASPSSASNIGNFTLSGFKSNPGFSTSALQSVASPSSQSLFSKVGTAAGNAFNSNPIGTAAGLAGGVGLLGSKAPSYNAPSPEQNYSAIDTFLGKTPQGQATNNLNLSATNANTDIVNTSIQDLQKQFTGNNQRTLDTINTAYDNQKQSLVHSYAQAGQNLANSSELQSKVQQLEQKRSNDLILAQQELQDQALGQAVQVKQQALSSGMQAGQFNQTLAMQLASLTGDQQNLQYAIANNDYQSFQQIMGKLLTMGIPQSVNVTNNGNTATLTRTGGL